MKPTCITCKANCHNAGTTSKIVDCSQYKPGRILTNADRIRAMTDEELAGIFLRADFLSVVSMKKAEYAISSVLIQTFRFMKGAGKLH